MYSMTPGCAGCQLGFTLILIEGPLWSEDTERSEVKNESTWKGVGECAVAVMLDGKLCSARGATSSKFDAPRGTRC